MSISTISTRLHVFTAAGKTGQVFTTRAHAYTRTLLAAIPLPDPQSDWLTQN